MKDKTRINKPLSEWTPLEIATYAVNCDNSEERIEEVERMIQGSVNYTQKEIMEELWSTLVNGGIEAALKKFNVSRKES